MPDTITNTLNTFEFNSDVRTPEIICYVPEANYCASYREDDVSATLATGYHYGGGGDAAMILMKHATDCHDPSCTEAKTEAASR